MANLTTAINGTDIKVYDSGTNITVASSTTTETQYLEYMVFADGIVTAKG